MMNSAQKEWNEAWRNARADFYSEVDDTVATTPLEDRALRCLIQRQTRRLHLRDRLYIFKSKKRVSNFLD